MSMTSLLDRPMTVPEFLAWSEERPEERYELVNGKVVGMVADSVGHNLTKFAAASALNDAVRARGLPCLVLIDGVGVKINNLTLRIPDVLVHCGAAPRLDSVTVDAPVVVVEVVSPSSERDDVETKLIDYFSVASIEHYLIIFSERRVIVHHRRSESGSIETRIAHEGEIALVPPGITVTVATMLGRSSVAGGRESA